MDTMAQAPGEGILCEAASLPLALGSRMLGGMGQGPWAL